jgi:hypothetical protein
MGCAVGEQVVDDHSDDGEEEDDERPEDLFARATVGLDDFNYNRLAYAISNRFPLLSN